MIWKYFLPFCRLPFHCILSVAQIVKPLPAMQETQVRSLGWEDPLQEGEKEMATHFSVLAWRIPGTGELGGLPSMYGVAQSRTRLK